MWMLRCTTVTTEPQQQLPVRCSEGAQPDGRCWDVLAPVSQPVGVRAHLSVFTLSCTLGLFSSESTSAPACGGAGCLGGACASSMPPGKPPLAWMAAGCRREGSCPRRKWAPVPSRGRGAIMPGASISCEDMSAGTEGLAQTRGAVGGKRCQRGTKAQSMTPGQTRTAARCPAHPHSRALARGCCTAVRYESCTAGVM